jgi:hypothetical protein
MALHLLRGTKVTERAQSLLDWLEH